MGFGLFVPEFRAEFSMSSAEVGYVSSLGFLGMLVGLVLAQPLLFRKGPYAPVVLGLAAATVGMAIVAASAGLPLLATGVFIAGSSAGFAWSPFNDAVNRKVADRDRPLALSEISTGTSAGIVIAGLAALALVLTDLSWRRCWEAFALASAAALVANWGALRRIGKAPCPAIDRKWSYLMQFRALPLFAIALVFGVVSSVYISFAADHLLNEGGVTGMPVAAVPALVFMVFGCFGFAGLVSGGARRRIGLFWLLRLLMCAGALSAALVALLPAGWLALLSSAALQGIFVMMTSAVMAFWSERLFPDLPSSGFAAALLATAAGSILGPAVAGLVSEAFGAETMFLGTAALPAITAILMRRNHIQERPQSTSASTLRGPAQEW